MNGVIKKSRTALASLLVMGAATLVGCGGSGGGDSSNASGLDGTPGTHSATLSWNAPATRINGDGLAMGELQGYVINYGQEAGSLSNKVRIGDANVMDYTIGGLGNGAWYFTIQVVDTNGLMSAPSAMVSKTI
ncbi:fibronectin type III domain-containing protein [Marinobacter zhejiangensis]|uniref:Fibronectin type-III domain-containing protein n=1 Tax=Marinobacter zhejiangensis TaxID=488535 RepID=A0A1I4QSP6_9GAMM|nr:fibronectin type III domain-containing protein [Marinobacter zhejiangensis]SFM43061.1 hypothetical protein SAMN04487963_2558 [Marinobacter zhejiangensis]